MKVYDNYTSLINIGYKKNTYLVIFPIIMLTMFILTAIIDVYDNIQLDYFYTDGEVTVIVPVQNSDAVVNAEYAILNNQKYSFKITDISFSEEMGYQNIIIDIPNTNNMINNQMGTIIFNYNKEKIIKKISKLFF